MSSNIISISDLKSLQVINNDEYIRQLIDTNDYSSKYGLTLTPEQAQMLIETRNNSLRDNSRIEIGLGAVEKIINNFSESPYIDNNNYAETINDLLELFYYYKTETHDRISDVKLIELMRNKFDNEYKGSIELMQSNEFRYNNNYDELPFEYKNGCGDDSGDNPEDSSENDYVWDIKDDK